MLTVQQMQTLRAHIVADPVLGPLSSGPGTDYAAIAAALNANSAGFYGWTTATPEALESAIMSASTQLDGLAANKRDCLLWAAERPQDCRDVNRRNGLYDFCGGQVILRTAVTNTFRKVATLAEKLLTGGLAPFDNPVILVWEGIITIEDINAIMAS